MTNDIHLGKLIVEEMERKRRTNAYMAEKMDISPSTFGLKLQKSDFGSVAELIKVCTILGRNFFIDAEKCLPNELCQYPSQPEQPKDRAIIVEELAGLLGLQKRMALLEHDFEKMQAIEKKMGEMDPIFEKLKKIYQ
jgi:hypothetical protein